MQPFSTCSGPSLLCRHDTSIEKTVVELKGSTPTSLGKIFDAILHGRQRNFSAYCGVEAAETYHRAEEDENHNLHDMHAPKDGSPRCADAKGELQATNDVERMRLHWTSILAGIAHSPQCPRSAKKKKHVKIANALGSMQVKLDDTVGPNLETTQAARAQQCRRQSGERGRLPSSSNCSGFHGVVDCTADKLQIHTGCWVLCT